MLARLQANAAGRLDATLKSDQKAFAPYLEIIYEKLREAKALLNGIRQAIETEVSITTIDLSKLDESAAARVLNNRCRLGLLDNLASSFALQPSALALVKTSRIMFALGLPSTLKR